MIRLNANVAGPNGRKELGDHPLSPFTHAAVDLAKATGEDVELTYNDVPVTITEAMSYSDAYTLWHHTASERHLTAR